MTKVEITPGDFPFEEIRQPSGDYFDTIAQAMEAGHHLNQIWSVTEDNNTFTYGPPGHFVNLLGYVATKQTHNSRTFYEEYCPTSEGK